jgi:hypothetical protein
MLILWRGSPGWSYRRSNVGGSMSGGSPTREGVVPFALHQGGLVLTADYDLSSHIATVLGERVELKGAANVIFVDRVDSPDGPVVAGTATLPSTTAPSASLPSMLRESPELLAYLRCEAQLPEPINQTAMNRVCTEAIVRGLITAAQTVTAVPLGPVTNRAAATGPAPQPEPPSGPGQSSGSGALSPVVVGGWFTSHDGAGVTWLDLLVLWRGSLGWAMKGQIAGGSSGGSMTGARRGMTVRGGGLSFYAAFNAGPRTCEIDSQTVPLGDDNVVLVDDVDSERGPHVVKTLRVDPAMSGSPTIDTVIARSSELKAYLRCDLKLPDAMQQTMMDVLCARYAGK